MGNLVTLGRDHHWIDLNLTDHLGRTVQTIRMCAWCRATGRFAAEKCEGFRY